MCVCVCIAIDDSRIFVTFILTIRNFGLILLLLDTTGKQSKL